MIRMTLLAFYSTIAVMLSAIQGWSIPIYVNQSYGFTQTLGANTQFRLSFDVQNTLGIASFGILASDTEGGAGLTSLTYGNNNAEGAFDVITSTSGIIGDPNAIGLGLDTIHGQSRYSSGDRIEFYFANATTPVLLSLVFETTPAVITPPGVSPVPLPQSGVLLAIALTLASIYKISRGRFEGNLVQTLRS